MVVQLHPVRVKMHALFGSEQNPLHCGRSASPHDVVRHSQAPLAAVAVQRPPPPHDPSQLRLESSKWHGPPSVVVVVLDVGVGPGTAPPRDAAVHMTWAFRKSTVREPPRSSPISNAGGEGRAHFTV
jgi:hypothetical protein